MSASPGLPADCRTRLECRTCKGGAFQVCWNWTGSSIPLPSAHGFAATDYRAIWGIRVLSDQKNRPAQSSVG